MSFKVINKAPTNQWVYELRSKITTTSQFFGLFKTSRVEETAQGPAKDEICIVTDHYIYENQVYYILAGYPYGSYNSKYFIRLDEFTESQKEIAEKIQPALN